MLDQDLSFGNLDAVQGNSFEPIPVGTYKLRAVDMEMKDTKAGTGKYISVEFVVVGGQYDDRKIFERYNVVNSNPTSVEIALANIKDWITATGGDASGELKLSTIQSLEGKTFNAKVAIHVDKSGQYDDSNKIKKFLAPSSSVAANQTQVTSTVEPQAAQAQPAASKKPWEK